LNILAYADKIVLIGKSEVEIGQHFVETENVARKLRLQINQEKIKYMLVKRENILNKKDMKIKNY
jgi:ribosomal protein L21